MPAKRTSSTAKTKKTVQKKSATTTSVVKASIAKSAREKNFRTYLTRRNLLATFAIIVIIIAGIFLRNKLTVATVNGEAIGKIQFLNELEKEDGKRVLENLVTQKLIDQESKRRNISISDQEVNSEIEKIKDSLKKRGQNIEEVLAVRGLTIDKAKEQIKNNLILKKLLSDSIKVSDKEIDDYIEKNKESTQPDPNIEIEKNTVRDQLEQQKLEEKAQELLKKLQSQAKINYFIKL